MNNPQDTRPKKPREFWILLGGDPDLSLQKQFRQIEDAPWVAIALDEEMIHVREVLPAPPITTEAKLEFPKQAVEDAFYQYGIIENPGPADNYNKKADTYVAGAPNGAWNEALKAMRGVG